MPPLRVVFMGTPEFSVPSLAMLADSEHVTLVVTNPDRPAGRGQALAVPPVKAEAARRGIPVFQPEKAKAPESVARIAAENPDLIVVVAYGHILPPSILSVPKHGCINVHASLLPKYRGAAPINWAIARGETETGVTIMRMDPGMDTGPMLHVRTIAIGENETAGTMFPKLAALGAEALGEALRKLHDGTLTETPQDNALASYAPMLKKEHGLIDWGRPAREVRNLVRGMTPWPSAYVIHGGKTLKVLGAGVADGGGAPAQPPKLGEGHAESRERGTGTPGQPAGTPGEIVAVGKDGIVVACGEGALRLEQVQPEGGKAMTAWAYAQGRRIRKGDRLSP